MSGLRERSGVRISVKQVWKPGDPHVVARKGGGKGGSTQAPPHSPTEDPNSLRSKSTARILEVLSEGPIRGAHTQWGWWQSVYLDGTPVQNSDGSTNFSMDQLDWRLGYPNQDIIPGFNGAESEVNVGVELKPNNVPPFAGTVRRLSSGTQGLRVKLRVNALYEQTDQGDIHGSTVYLVADFRVGDGGWFLAAEIYISGKTMSPYERTIWLNCPSSTDTVDIRITRYTWQYTSRIVDTTYWSSYTEINWANIEYADTAIVGMAMDAQYFSSIPQRAYLLDGLLCQIPNNYDPFARTYAGDWSGTFQVQWTNNPAWVLYDLLSNPRYGVGRDINVLAVDKWSFYEAAQYNDQLVPNGRGGYEPRFTCNCVINTRQDAYTVLNTVASCMRALLYYSNGTIFLVQDRPAPAATRMFTPADVIEGIFDYSSTDVRSRFTVANVTWNDPDDSYNPAVEMVPDNTLVATKGYRETNQTAFGCTVRGQAIRFGRWLVGTSQRETELTTFRVPLENADVRPGEVVGISDPSRVGARLGGRTLDDPGDDVLALDKYEPSIAVGWTIWLNIASSIIGTTVVAVLPDNQVRVTGKPADGVPAATVWVAGSSTVVVPTLWRVVSLKENGAGVYEVLCTYYDQTKYDYIDYNVSIAPPPFSMIPSGPLKPPSNLAVDEFIYLDNTGTPQFGVVASWEPSADSRVSSYNVELEGPGLDYRKFERINGTNVDVQPMRMGAWTVTLIAQDSLGRRSSPVTYSFNTVGLTAKPQAPQGLYLSPQGDYVQLTWTQTPEVDVAYWWVKWSKYTDEHALWERATTIAARVSRQTIQFSAPKRPGTYFVKAVDSIGQESQSAASAVLMASQTQLNTLLHFDEQTAWSGARSLFEIDDEELWLRPPTTPDDLPPGIFPGNRGTAINATPTRVGVYSFAGSVDLGSETTVALTSSLESYGTLQDDSMSQWKPLASAVPLARFASTAFDGHIEVAPSRDGIAFDPWQLLESATMSARKLQFRLIGTLYDLQTTYKVIEAAVTVSVPNRSLTGNDVVFDANGDLVVNYAPGFHATPNVQITARQNMGAGDAVRLVASDAAHFEAHHIDSAGNPVPGGSIDYLVQGYGVS